MGREEVAVYTLWSQFKNGDKDAFASLYQIYISDLISYGRRVCSDPDLLKDSIQDLFIELWNSRSQLSRPCSVKFYLLKALRYKLIRTEKKRNQQNPVNLIRSEINPSRFDLPVEMAIIDKEIQESKVYLLRRAMKSLSKRQSEVIQLRFYQGLSNEQIADLMNLNYQSVSNLMHSALSRIKNNLKAPALISSLAAAFFLFF
jgi:RNA polymerase sigma-70 factor (ECF subfamily)